MSDEVLYASCIKFIKEVIITHTGKTVVQFTDFYDSINTINDHTIREIKLTDPTESAKIRQIVYKHQQRKMDKFKDFYTDIGNPYPQINIEELALKSAEFISAFPTYIVQEQAPERFHAQPGNSTIIKSLKFFKRGLFSITVIPRRIVNVSLHLFGKSPKPIHYWNHTVPVREIAGYVIYQHMPQGLHRILEDFNLKSLRISKAFFERDQMLNHWLLRLYADSSVDFKVEKHDSEDALALDALYKNFIADTEDLAIECDKYIIALSEVMGTIDYPVWQLRWKSRKSNTSRVRLGIETQLQNWGNTTFALLEDWKIDQEIYWLKVNVEKSVNALADALLEKHEQIVEHLKIACYKIGLLKQEIIELLTVEKAEYGKLVIHALEKLKTGPTKQNLVLTVEQLISYNLPVKINDFEQHLVNQINQLSEKRWLTQKSDYSESLKKSDLSSFSLRELVMAGCFPKLSEQCASLKLKTVSEIERLRYEILNIEEVVAFNLSSLIHHEETESVSAVDIPALIKEGMERSVAKIEFIALEVGKFGDTMADQLKKITYDFNTATLALTKNESAFELRIIVMKAKALKKTEEFGIRMWNYIKSRFTSYLQKSKKVISDIDAFITPWRRRIGLGTSESGISSELSDFLSEAHKRINNLPVIYQRLYRIQPLTEMSFFIGREKEIKELIHAYKSHKDLKFAPTVIVGEKWCGHTTLINYIKAKHLDKSIVLTGELKLNISTSGEFYEFWKTLLKKDTIESMDALIEILRTEYNGKTIIIENIHNFYLRTINGFENLDLFIRLVTMTYTYVFWLFSANKYAWNYLCKTKDIAGYFGYVIEMKPYSDQELRELIVKKNSVSGYRIQFQQSDSNEQDKKFQALDEKEKQTFLRDQFFKDLNSYAKGNISLGLAYWLLATGKITENTIEIVKFQPPDLSFIKQLNAEKIFILFLIIMHDGLTIEQLSRVYKKPINTVQLLVIMLLDDGVLIERSGWYEVNPLIYRQTIEALKARNLIN